MTVTTRMRRVLREGAVQRPALKPRHKLGVKESVASEFRDQLRDFLGSLERVDADLRTAGDKLSKVSSGMRRAGYEKYASAFEKLLNAAREDLERLQNKVDAVIPF